MRQGYKLIILFACWALCGTSLKAQNSFFNQLPSQANPLVHSMRLVKPDAGKEQDLLKGAIEDVSKRTPYSSTWKTKTGKTIINYSSVIINYPDANGNLQPIDLTLHSDANGWVADKQPSPCYFHSDRSTAISLGENKEFTFNKNSAVNGMLLDQHIESMKGGDIKLNLSQGVHKEINFITGGIETNYIFDSPLEGGINVSEEVQFPEGCSFQPDLKNGAKQDGGWSGDYVLLASGGQVLARFQAAECYDAKKHWCFADYSIQKKDGKNILVTSIPSAWLATAVYPVTLDPLVISGAIWNGGSSPSSPYPSFSTDSILVTIPAGITITYFTVAYAYVSSEVGQGIPTSDGIFYLSTPCGRTDTTSCHSDTAGVCYLEPNEDFHSYMTCCYGPSCSPQTFWLDAHLSRRYGGFGSDTSTIWYTKAGYAGLLYHFSAFLEGYTDSITNISYNPHAQCSNTCTITMNTVVEYGVPPYTVSHPWAARDTIIGAYSFNSCASGGIAPLVLTIPGCPYTCGGTDTILIPSPLVVDACGDTAASVPAMKYVIHPTPVLTVSADTVKVCSGTPVTLTLLSCVSGTTFNWSGSDKTSGSSSSNTISDNTLDTNTGPMIVNYNILGSANGCNSDTNKPVGVINPYPAIVITGATDTLLLGASEKIQAKGGNTYSWVPAEGLSCTNCPNPVVSPSVTTIYTLTSTDSGGCESLTPFIVIIKDENVIVPNVFTPNGDGINEHLIIANLQDYPNSNLVIYNRWGAVVYTSSNYQNNWDGGGQSDGVYFYVLTLPTGKKYHGFFQLMK